MKAKPTPSADYLRSRLDYDPDTGILTWKHNPDAPAKWNTRYAGTTAGYVMQTGRVLLALDGERWLAHRFIWKMMTGEEAPPELDHENTMPFDNRWENLRTATRSQNECNKPHKTRARGVSPHGRGWTARIHKNKKQIGLGTFATEEDAIEAYRRAAWELHGEYAHKSVRDSKPLGREPVRSAGHTGATGVIGVSSCANGKYRARIHRDGREVHLGVFDTIEQALAARLAAITCSNSSPSIADRSTRSLGDCSAAAAADTD